MSADAQVKVYLTPPRYAPIGLTLNTIIRVTCQNLPVTISYVMPVETTFHSITRGDAAMICTTPPVGSTGTVTCSLATPDSGTVISVSSDVPASIATDAQLTMSASASQSGTTVYTGGMSTTKPPPAGTLAITAPPSVVPGSALDLLVTVTNTDTVTRKYTVFDNNARGQLYGFSFVSAVQMNGMTQCLVSPTNWSCNTFLDPGTTAQFDIGAQTTPSLEISSGIRTGLNAADFNTIVATATTPIAGSVVATNLVVTGYAPAAAKIGDDIAFAVSARNLSANVSTGVLQWTPPPGTTFISATSPCVADQTGSVSCTLPSITEGTSWPIVFHMLATTPGTITNTATITAATFPEANPADNSVSAVTIVTGHHRAARH